MTHSDIMKFSMESNTIEGIRDLESFQQMSDLLTTFITLEVLDLKSVIKFAEALGGKLREKKGMDVRVGYHIPPRGDPSIRQNLESILFTAMHGGFGGTPFGVHKDFETLHPFTDGNGRTGRAVWLWMMLKSQRSTDLGFLHHWYYQSLDSNRGV